MAKTFVSQEVQTLPVLSLTEEIASLRISFDRIENLVRLQLPKAQPIVSRAAEPANTFPASVTVWTSYTEPCPSQLVEHLRRQTAPTAVYPQSIPPFESDEFQAVSTPASSDWLETESPWVETVPAEFPEQSRRRRRHRGGRKHRKRTPIIQRLRSSWQ